MKVRQSFLTGVLVLFGIVQAGCGRADDATHAHGQKLIRTFSTLDTRVTVGVDPSGRLAVYELSNPAARYNWTSEPSVIPLPTRATINGGANYSPVTWEFRSASKPSKSAARDRESVVLTFSCSQSPGLVLSSVWWAASNRLPGPVQHTFRIVNNTAYPVTLSEPYLDLAARPHSGKRASLWTFGDQIGKLEKHDMASGFHLSVNSNGGNMGQPMPFALIDDSSAGGLYIGMEEQKDFMIAVNTQATSVRVSARHLSQHSLSIAAGSTASTPPIYLGVYQGDMEDGSNQFKRWFWNNKTPANHRNDPTAPWAVFGGNWAYNNAPELWWSEEATYRKGVEHEGLADIGFDAVEVDAYWDKAEEKGYWPSGTKIMGPLAHANGLKLNLYLMKKVTWETRDYLKTIWAQYGMDMWRNDFQVTDLDVQAWARKNCPANYRFDMSPSSADFRSMTYVSQVDLYLDDPAATRQCFYNLSYVIPPGQICMLIHIPYALGSVDKFKYYFRSTMLGGPWMAVLALGAKPYNPTNVALPSDFPEVMPSVRANLALYRSTIRPLIREGDLYHTIVDPASGFDGAEYYSSSSDKGVVLLFGPAGKKTVVRLKGLNPDRQYRLVFTDQPARNSVRSGAHLMGEGLPVEFTGTVQSEIVLIQGIRSH